MNSKITHMAAFAAGAAAGGIAAWRYARKKYERIAEEEIRSVKETYSRKAAAGDKSPDGSAAPALDQQPRESVLDYAALLRRKGYLPSEETDKKEEPPMLADAPYTISPDEFGEYDGYEEISLTYYSDGILADENDEVVEEPDEIVGPDFSSHFGEYEEDSVFVRNDKLRCDYEILLDQRPYSEVLKAKPYLRREE